MINPRLKDLSSRLKSDELAQKDRQVVEETQRRTLEQIASKEAKAKKEKEDYVSRLESDKQRQEAFKVYFEELDKLDFFDTSIENDFYAFVKHPDFPKIFNKTKTLNTVDEKWGHLVRRGYEMNQEIESLRPLGMEFRMQHHEVYFKRRLEGYGLYLLCPFFKEDENVPTKQSCIIDGSEDSVMSSCDGNHEICEVFSDRAKKAATGLVQITFPTRQEPKYKIPNIEVNSINKRDLEDWWLQEGKYE